MRRSKSGILTKSQAVMFAVLTGALYLLSLTILDYIDDGKAWSEAVRGNVLGALFLVLWMSAFFYFWPRWVAKRKATVTDEGQ